MDYELSLAQHGMVTRDAEQKPIGYAYHMPRNGVPREGDVLISCPNHPGHVVRWNRAMLRMLRYFRG